MAIGQVIFLEKWKRTGAVFWHLDQTSLVKIRTHVSPIPSGMLKELQDKFMRFFMVRQVHLQALSPSFPSPPLSKIGYLQTVNDEMLGWR